MSLLKMISRCTETAVKLPFAMAWDVISLGNMGDGASTSKILREHERQKYVDELTDALELVQQIKKSE